MLLFTITILSVALGSLESQDNVTEIELIELELAKADSRLNIASKLIENAREQLRTNLKGLYRKNHCVNKPADDLKPLDCSDVYKNDRRDDGIYEVWPRNRNASGPLRVYCDMQDGGGWTVIQRRGDFGNPSDYFFKDWNSYKIGFGDLEKEFWLGNDNIFALTNQKLCSIKIELWDWENNFKYAIYDVFIVSDETERYRLNIRKYRGTAGDSFLRGNDDYSFSTKDRDNDIRPDFHCAEFVKGAWWFSNCLSSNLNGIYNKQVPTSWAGICWYTFTNSETHGLKKTVMKIRPVVF